MMGGKNGFNLNALHWKGLKNITVNMHPPGPRRKQRDLEKTKVKAKNSESKDKGGRRNSEGVESAVTRGRRRSVSHILTAPLRSQILLAVPSPTWDF